MTEVDDILTPLSGWLKEKKKTALATVISTWGSSPRPVGGQMAIDQNGEIIGSVSGGCIEGAVILEGIKSLGDGKTRVKDYGISNDMAWEVGLACGGELKVLIQPLEIEDNIIYSMVESIKKRQVIKLRINSETGLRKIDNSIENQSSCYDKLENEFKKFTQNMKPIMNTWIQPYLGNYLPGLYKRGFLPSIISKEKKMLYTNLIRCESHRDVLISAIKPTQK